MSAPFGDKEFTSRIKFPTPTEIPDERACRTFNLPASTAWQALLMGAVMILIDPKNFVQFDGGITAEETAEEFFNVVWETYFNDATCQPGLPTPFWDEAQDLDDELPFDDQIWYGEVTDPDAPADELEFVENAAIWTITGFVAVSAGIGSAIFFNTIAPRFVLAWKRGDIGELIRVVIDSADYGTVDTSTVAVGEVIELDVLPVTEAETHDIMLVRVEA